MYASCASKLCCVFLSNSLVGLDEAITNAENKNNKNKTRREKKRKEKKKGVFSHFIWQFHSFLPSFL